MRNALGFLLTLATAGSVIAVSCLEVREGCQYTGACNEEATGGTGGSNGTGGDGGAGTGGASACAAACEGATPHCDEESGQCLECLESSDCMDAAAPRCDGGACVGCTEAEDCVHIADGSICNDATGACVGCLSENDCDGNVCAPSTGTCTTLPAHTQQACEACEHDAQCQAGQVCVETTYDDPEDGIVGTFCLWHRDAALPGPNGSCGLNSRPFARQANVTSVDGVPATVCELRTTTCPALLQHGTTVDDCEMPFEDDSACGASGFNDGRCRLNTESEPQPQCSYPCLGNQDCWSGSTCPAAGDRYCSL